ASVGLHVPANAVLSIKHRALNNLGEGTITLRLAKGPKREARTIELQGKASADYNELRRCAAERAAESPWPPNKPGQPIVPKGTLVIVGGGGMTGEIAK